MAAGKQQRGVAAVFRKLRPGSRLLVDFEEVPGWSHERLITWPFGDGRSFALTAGGDRYGESAEDNKAAVDIASFAAMPKEVEQMVAFEEPLTKKRIRHYVLEVGICTGSWPRRRA